MTSPSDAPERHVRPGAAQIEALLDELDRAGEPLDLKQERRSPRQSHRELVRVEFREPGHTTVRYAAYTRNISHSGVGLLVGQFVYPGTRCTVHLVTPGGEWQVVHGTVVRCRYLSGTQQLHEVGIKLDTTINLGAFAAEEDRQRKRRILLADDDVLIHKLVRSFLKVVNAEVTCVTNGAEAVKATENDAFDLVLMDLEMPEMDGYTAASTMRQRGYVQPIVAITACEGDDTRAACIKAGFDDYLTKPIVRETLIRLVTDVARPPLVSSLAEQADMAELINEFVAGLPEKIQKLKEAYAAQDYERLAMVVRQIKGQGSPCGFTLITELAAKAEAAIQNQANQVAIRDALNELIGWCLAAQPVGTDEQQAEPAAATEEAGA